jgi:hypothetical protein
MLQHVLGRMSRHETPGQRGAHWFPQDARADVQGTRCLALGGQRKIRFTSILKLAAATNILVRLPKFLGVIS